MRAALAALEEAFGVEHERTYGHRAGVEEPVELVSLEVIGTRHPRPAARRTRPPPPASPPTSRSPRRRRRAYFGPPQGWLDTASSTAATSRRRIPGPCIVEEYDATCLVPPGWTARLDAFGNIELQSLGGKSCSRTGLDRSDGGSAQCAAKEASRSDELFTNWPVVLEEWLLVRRHAGNQLLDRHPA